jgi:hypothetical protein
MAEKKDTSNAEKAVAFLKAFREQGNINVVAIHPESGEVNGITKPISDPYIEKFIAANEGTCNLYFMVNEPSDHASPTGKLKKADVAKIHGLWIDADPKKGVPFADEKVRLNHFANQLSEAENPPTYIIDSGGGIQSFWLFDKPIEATEANITHCEALSRGLAHKYDTDKVQNIDRIMRIPYTTNVPTQKKLDQGRTKSLAKVLHAQSPRGYRYKEVKFIKPVEAAQNEQDINDYDMSKLKEEIPQDLKSRLTSHCQQHGKLNKIWNGTLMKSDDRSDWDFALADELKLLGYSLDETAQIMYCFEHGKGKEQTPREIARCYGRAAEDFTDIDPDYVAQIEKQVNPLEKPNHIEPPEEGATTKRLKTIAAYNAKWKLDSRPLVKKLIDQKTIVVMYGQSNTGKSFVATDIAGHVATGRNWGEHKIPKQFGVLYICAEAGMSYSRRIAALRERLGITETCGLKKFPYEYVAMGVNFLTPKDDIKDVVILAKEQEKRTGIPVGLIVIDTLATTFSGGNENSSEDMGKYIEHMKFIQEHAQSAVLVVHHSGKDQAAGARGHSSLRAATDTELEVTSTKQGEKYNRKIRTKKQRDGESDTELPFNLKVIELGRDEDNDPITTCHVVLPNDNDFEDLSPEATDGLNEKEKAAYEAVNVYLMQDPNPDTYDLTKKELMTRMYLDCLNENGVLKSTEGERVGVWDLSNASIMSKPTQSEMKAFTRALDKLVDKEVMEKIVFK